MAFQFQVDPDLAAKVTYEGIMAGARGFSQGIEKLGAGLAKGLEKQKEDAKMFKGLQEYADSAGIATKEQTTPMDLNSLKGLVEGTIAKQHNAEALQRLQMNDQMQKMRELQMRGMQQGIDEPEQDRRLYDELSQIGQPAMPSRAATVGRVDEGGGMIPGSLAPAPAGIAAMGGQQNLYNPQAVLGAIKRAGWAGQPEKIDNFIQRLQAGTAGAQGGLPEMHELPGAPDYQVFTMPGTKQMDVRPKMSVGTTEVFDSDGNPITLIRQGNKFIIPKATKKITGDLIPATDPVTGEHIPGFYTNPNTGQTVDARTTTMKAVGKEIRVPDATTNSPGLLKRLFGGGGAAPAAKPAKEESPDDDVKVVAPNGKVGTVKRKDLKAALAKGLKPLE